MILLSFVVEGLTNRRISMKNLLTASAFLFLAGCATIGPEHEKLSVEIEKGIGRQETAYFKLVDKFEKDGMARIDERVRLIEGPIIMKHAIETTNFQENICEKEGKLAKAFELLEFTLDASAKYEQRKAKYIRAFRKLLRGLRSAAREEYGRIRRAAAAQTAALRAYNKDKEWRKEILRSLDVPVDQVDALNQAALEFDKMLKTP